MNIQPQGDTSPSVVTALELMTSQRDNLRSRVEELQKEVSHWQIQCDVARLQRMDKEKEVKQMEELIGGLDVNNPDTVDVLIDALNIQKRNLNEKVSSLQEQISAKDKSIEGLEGKLKFAKEALAGMLMITKDEWGDELDHPSIKKECDKAKEALEDSKL